MINGIGLNHILLFILRLVPLLFQTGYLTVKEKKDGNYILDYPNKEVRESMYQFMKK